MALVDATNVFDSVWSSSNPIDVPVSSITGLQDNDQIIALCAYRLGATAISAPAGWDEIEAKDGSGGSWEIAIFKRTASSESGNWTFTVDNASGADGLVLVSAFRPISTNSPLDIPYVRADHQSGTTADATPAPPDITTNSDGCTIVQMVIARTSGSNLTITAPTNYTEAVAYETGNFAVNGAIAYREQTTAGLEDAADWNIGTTSQNADTFVIALRAAAAIEISGITYSPPTGFDYVAHDGLVIPSDSVLYNYGGQATGGTTTTATTELDLALNEVAGLIWRNTSTDESSTIVSNTAGPNSTITFGAVTTATTNLDYFEIVADIDTSDQIQYESSVTVSSEVASLDWAIVDITDDSHTSTYTATISATGAKDGTYDVSMSVKGVPLLTLASAGAGGIAPGIMSRNIKIAKKRRKAKQREVEREEETIAQTLADLYGEIGDE